MSDFCTLCVGFVGFDPWCSCGQASGFQSYGGAVYEEEEGSVILFSVGGGGGGVQVMSEEETFLPECE